MILSANDEWFEALLEEVTRPDAPIGYGIVQPGPYVPGGIPVIAIRDLPKPAMQAVHRSSPHIESQYRRSRVTPGDILISVKGTTGRVGLVPDGFEGNISRDVARVRLREEQEPRYWFQLLRSAEVQTTLQLAAVGTTRQELSIGTLKKLSFRFPDRNEQERVAEILADADELIASIERAIAKKQAIKQSLMQQLLTGRSRLSGFTDLWPKSPLGIISAFITKGSTPTTYGFKWESTGVPFLRSECVSDRGLDMRESMFISTAANEALRRSKVMDGDILITITGNVGRVIRLAGIGAANINQHIARVRIKDQQFDGGFVYHYLSQRAMRDYYESIVTGQAYPQISLKQVRSTDIPAPPLEEQRAIAEILDDADTELAVLQARLTKAHDVKTGMMQQLLTGRTRLPV
jgi:type I restriction enzyme S subunit